MALPRTYNGLTLKPKTRVFTSIYNCIERLPDKKVFKVCSLLFRRFGIGGHKDLVGKVMEFLSMHDEFEVHCDMYEAQCKLRHNESDTNAIYHLVQYYQCIPFPMYTALACGCESITLEFKYHYTHAQWVYHTKEKEWTEDFHQPAGSYTSDHVLVSLMLSPNKQPPPWPIYRERGVGVPKDVADMLDYLDSLSESERRLFARRLNNKQQRELYSYILPMGLVEKRR